ncbi:AAA family ATPase [archaeon]|jgi:archaeal cell division control protein 6|nr:AAA family ATPase [archaeon]MBT4373050.1 AAA family ATPase [archaeon]MBT4531395.1 AAA family ATPase [archaeon]MBT7282034.1 AAA family ATPase [archaeon]
MGTDLDNIFDSIIKNSIFKKKEVLQTSHNPENIPHREKQIKQIASILAPVLRGERTSNLFLYGKTGTGKTLSIKYVKDELLKRVSKDADFSLKIEYLNCKLKKVSDTEYRILAELIKKLGGSVPDTGLPTQAVYSKFIDLIDNEKQLIVLILDEIDQTMKKISSDFLYNLTRLNSELSKTQICVVGISNNLTFLDELDPRVRSSLSEEELVFPPYNALQLQDILKKRSKDAFKEGVLEEGVLSKCAAFAAREHGDARRALDLLRVAGELAERDNSNKILVKHIDTANNKIEKDKILDVISSEPKQFQFVLASIIQLSEERAKGIRGTQRSLGKDGKEDPIFTGDVYNLYQDICTKNKIDILTQRRVSDIIQEFDMLGIINVRVISKGRGGRMREIKLAITKEIAEKSKEIIKDSIDYW